MISHSIISIGYEMSFVIIYYSFHMIDIFFDSMSSVCGS